MERSTTLFVVFTRICAPICGNLVCRKVSYVVTVLLAGTVLGNPCEDVEEECMVVTGERPTCPEGFICFTTDGDSIWPQSAVVPEIYPEPEETSDSFMDEMCKGHVDEMNAQACEAWRKKKEVAKELLDLPACPDLLYTVADEISFSGLITGAVSGWKLINDPNAEVKIKLKKVVVISFKAVAKVSIVATVAGEVTKKYCKMVAINTG